MKKEHDTAHEDQRVGGWTPGPWAAFTDDSGAEPHTNIVAFKPRTACVFSLPGRHKDEADVRRLAALPDLVEALRDCLGWHDFSDDLHKPIEVRAAYMRARSALLKATGSASGEQLSHEQEGN